MLWKDGMKAEVQQDTQCCFIHGIYHTVLLLYTFYGELNIFLNKDVDVFIRKTKQLHHEHEE
jgi:hypothetical protein